LCPTEAVRHRLRAMAASSMTTNHEYAELTQTLAYLDENEALATAVYAGANVSHTVLDIRQHKSPFPESIVRQAENDVRHGDGEHRKRAILVLALSNRTDVQPTLVHVLQTCEPTSPEVRLAIVALDALGLCVPEVLPIIAAVLRVEDSRRIACKHLLGRGDEKGRALLVDYLARHPLDRLTSIDEQLAFQLLHYPDSVPGAQGFLRRILGRGFGKMIRGNILSALAHAGDRSVRDELYEVAFQVSGSESGGWHAAVQRLAGFDPDAALAAAQRRLERDASPDVVELLMAMNKSQGTDTLLGHITQELRPTIRYAIARALRWYADRSALEDRLSAMTTHSDPRQREAAAELCGWQPPCFLTGRIVELVDDDMKEVEQAALNALRRQQNQRWVGELLDGIVAAEGANRWSLLLAAIDLGDPELLNHSEDTLCIWPVLKKFPIEYTIVAEERLERRREQVKRANESADRRHRP